MERSQWQDWTLFLIGFALVLVPYFRPPSAVEIAELKLVGGLIVAGFVLAGMVAAALAAIALVTRETWQQWAAIGLGLWLIGAPWLLGFAPAATLTALSLAAGIAILTLAALSLRAELR